MSLWSLYCTIVCTEKDKHHMSEPQPRSAGTTTFSDFKDFVMERTRQVSCKATFNVTFMSILQILAPFQFLTPLDGPKNQSGQEHAFQTWVLSAAFWTQKRLKSGAKKIQCSSLGSFQSSTDMLSFLMCFDCVYGHMRRHMKDSPES